MIKEIKKPNIKFKFIIPYNGKFYYDEENNEYFFKTECKSKFYFNLEGNIHRADKPAIEFFYERKEWAKNGKMHRLDGYAYIYETYKEFWINGSLLNENKFAEKTNHLLCKICYDFCKQECFI